MEFCPQALTDWRQAKCLTIKHLSKKCSIATEKLDAYEKGITTPTAKTINKIASALNINPIMLTNVARKHKYEGIEMIQGSMAGLIYLGRIQRGWSRDKLASESKCTTAVIASVESGTTARPRWENIWKVATVLDIPREKVAFS